MAKNDSTNRTSHRTGSDRERRRDAVVNTVKERPYTAAALATVAAGAAAFFLTRGKSDKPLMKWGQEPQGDHVKGAAAFKQGGSITDSSLETAGSTKSGQTAGTSTSPSAAQADSLAASGTSTNAAAGGGTGSSTSPAATSTARNAATGTKEGSALDQSAKTDTKVGAISYGA